MKVDYNFIAPYYDRLAQFVFGNAIKQAQQFLIQFIQPNSHILIIGGGTGWILEEITKAHPSGLQITYVDISIEMIKISRKRNVGQNKVNFISQPFHDVQLKPVYDVVITPFFLDNFSEDSVNHVIQKIQTSLRSTVVWLYADFQINEQSNIWQKLLLKIMYLFFQTVCHIEARKLPNVEIQFKSRGYQCVCSKTFFKDFIYAGVYKR